MLLEVLRITVFGAFVASSVVAVASWAVRTRRISPFGKTAQLVRRTSDPVLRPIENALSRRGGNPQQAEWWLLGGTVVGGIVVLSAADWIVREFAFISQTGVRGLVYLAARIFSWALIIRVIGSWMGVTRESPIMRPMYFLTDWIVEPLRRVIPPIGMIDITPIVAWFIIQIALGIFL